MPQMAPIGWLSLFIMFSLIFMLFNMMNYYAFFPTTPTTLSKKTSFFYSINWKW